VAEFLTTTGISHRLENIVKDAREKLILISPFLKVNERLKQLIEDKDREKIDIRVVYGKNELQPEENNWLKAKTSVRSSFCKNLHAKCFLNEEFALITSMNLYEFSQVNNEEMGILVSKSEDASLYQDVYAESMRLIRFSDEVRVSVEKVEEEKAASKRRTPRTTPKQRLATGTGFCIRCKKELKRDPTNPYCEPHLTTWNRFKDRDYEEKFCHLCGRPHKKATMRRPACRTCYDEHKDNLVFPAS